MKRIVVKNMDTGEVFFVNNTPRDKKKYVKCLYSEINWLEYSPLMARTIEKYKNVPLTRVKMTKWRKDRIAKNPSYADFIPRWEVKGYDRLVSSANFVRALTAEFWEMFFQNDERVVKCINKSKIGFKARLVEVKENGDA